MAQLSVPKNRTTIAPRIGIRPSFAALIVMVTGMRSSALSPILSTTCMPIRQLWHPVSAIAGSSVALIRFLSAKPRAWQSSSNALTYTQTYGCGADVRLCHLSQTLSYKWWSRAIALTLATGPFTIVPSSKAADCSSLVSMVSVGRWAYAMPRQVRSMWFTFLHLPQRLPYAGHWLLHMLHGKVILSVYLFKKKTFLL